MESSIDVLVPTAHAVVSQWYDLTEAAADGMPPHITLLWPWLPAVTSEAVDRLREVTSRIPPFAVSLGTTGRFPGVLYLEPKPLPPLLALARAVWAAFPETPPYGGTLDHEPVMHLTAAKGEHLDEAENVLRLRVREPLAVWVDKLAISQEGAGANGRWGVVAELELNG